MKTLFFRTALTSDGWADNVLIRIGDNGEIEQVTPDSKPSSGVFDGDLAVPGMANVHSHAFQRGFAGLGEWRGQGAAMDDDFWSWRQAMYRFVNLLRPEDMEVMAAQLYVEMLEAGFTAVGEFHYLHHQANGQPYDNLIELSARIAAAAEQSGIALTHLPVYYQFGGFGGQAADEGQRRFVNDPDRFSQLVEACRSLISGRNRLGIAPHSLRAVTPETLLEVIRSVPDCPIHIHIAEQVREVEDCLAWSGQRPVDWLFDNYEPDERWCLIHATHMTRQETGKVARSGVVAGLCPITEANLGDGIFDGVHYMKQGGRWGVGSDSHIRIDVAEELRTLEYSQRYRDLGRNRLVGSGGSNGRSLFDPALAGGAQALGQNMGAIASGFAGDLVSLDVNHPLLAGRAGDDVLNGWIFAGDKSVVRDVWVSGNHRVKDGRHVSREPIATRFAQTMHDIMAR